MALQILNRVHAAPVSYSSTSRARLACSTVVRLGSGASKTLTPLPRQSTIYSSRSPARARKTTVVTRASDLTFETTPEHSRDYAPVLGILGLVMWHYNRVSLNAPLLLKTIALYQLVVAAAALIFRKIEPDNLSTVVAPAVLAFYTLNYSQVTYMDAAVALFGYYLAEYLEGPFWFWIATLAGAIYAGYPSQWFVGAVALAAGTKLYRRGQKKCDKCSDAAHPGCGGVCLHERSHPAVHHCPHHRTDCRKCTQICRERCRLVSSAKASQVDKLLQTCLSRRL